MFYSKQEESEENVIRVYSKMQKHNTVSFGVLSQILPIQIMRMSGSKFYNKYCSKTYLRDCATMFSHIVKQCVTLSFLVVACSFFL